MRQRRIFLISLFLCSGAQAAPLSLSEAVKYALEHSPVLSSESHRAEIADLELKNAFSKFLPSLDASATHGIEKASPRNGTDPWVSTLNLGLTENLYDNGQSLTQHQIARLTREAAALALVKAKQQLALDVAQAFYRFSAGVALADVKKQQSDIFQKQFETVKSQFQQGLKARRDFLRLKSQAQRAVIDHRDATIEVEQSRVALRRLLGAPLQGEAVDFSGVQTSQIPAAAPKDAPPLDDTLEVRIAKVRSSVAPRQTNLAERRYWPQVGLTAGAFYDNSSYLGGSGGFAANDRYGWNVLLTLKYNILDWGERSRDIEKARRNELIAENELSHTKQAVNAEIRTLMLDLQQRENNLRSAKELLEVEEANFGLLKRDYEQGKVSSYDFILNLNDLLAAKVLLFRAQYGLAEGLARYHFYQGNLYEQIQSL